MPHKHRRSKTDRAEFELPPTTIAAPLSAIKKANVSPSNSTSKPQKKRKPKGPIDDTPKAFIRLQNLLRTGKQPSGLDDGNPKQSKKRKRSEPESSSNAKPAVPTIQPNERLTSFSARVDAALPLSTFLIAKTPKGADPVPGVKVKKTKKERKMQRMYEQWRIEDAKLKAKREEEAEGDDDELEDLVLEPKSGKKKRRSKRARRNGETGISDDKDPWKELAVKRGEMGKRPLNDVVQAPPHLPVVKQKMRIAGAGVLDGVPKAAGSLRRREELAELRSGVVEGYRRLVEGRRGATGADA